MPSLTLDGQTVMVTGAGKRLGRATSLALAEAGANIVIHYRSSASEANTLASEIKRVGRNAWTISGDLSDEAAASDIVARAIDLAGPIHGLVNSASMYPADTLLDATEESVIENLRVNAWAPFVLSRAIARQGVPASIVNFLDTRILDYDAKHVSYHLSKRTLHTLTRMTALEFAPRVRVNAVAPGLVLPPPGEGVSYLKALAHSNPLNAHGDAEDVARAVVFLFESRFITGQVIYVDGGRHMLGGVYG